MSLEGTEPVRSSCRFATAVESGHTLERRASLRAAGVLVSVRAPGLEWEDLGVVETAERDRSTNTAVLLQAAKRWKATQPHERSPEVR
jgi:hypothetical protein